MYNTVFIITSVMLWLCFFHWHFAKCSHQAASLNNCCQNDDQNKEKMNPVSMTIVNLLEEIG